MLVHSSQVPSSLGAVLKNLATALPAGRNSAVACGVLVTSGSPLVGVEMVTGGWVLVGEGLTAAPGVAVSTTTGVESPGSLVTILKRQSSSYLALALKGLVQRLAWQIAAIIARMSTKVTIKKRVVAFLFMSCL